MLNVLSGRAYVEEALLRSDCGMTLKQLLAQAMAFNPELGSIHCEMTVFADGDAFMKYVAQGNGHQIFGDSPDELLVNIREEMRAA